MTKEDIEKRIAMYLDAELKALAGERYKIRDKELERASIGEIRRGIDYWENKLRALTTKRGAKVTRIVPRDV